MGCTEGWFYSSVFKDLRISEYSYLQETLAITMSEDDFIALGAIEDWWRSRPHLFTSWVQASELLHLPAWLSEWIRWYTEHCPFLIWSLTQILETPFLKWTPPLSLKQKSSRTPSCCRELRTVKGMAACMCAGGGSQTLGYKLMILWGLRPQNCNYFICSYTGNMGLGTEDVSEKIPQLLITKNNYKFLVRTP